MEIESTSTQFDTFATLNQFNYSAVEMENLGATEYSLINILVDESGSVASFETELNSAMETVLASCKKHPRSQNVLLRTAAFEDSNIREIHGFTTIDTIDESIMKIHPGGMTPLWDATLDSIETMTSYAKTLSDHDYFCNGVIMVITDGCENRSVRANMGKIKDAVKKIRIDESLESIKLILIGVNDAEPTMKQYLDEFKNDAGFDEYVSIENATPSSLAKMADWISHSISSASQALGSGGASQACNFTL